MSSLTNINNNASVINIGRTTPVSPGAQPASQSIPVVVATDQAPIPVIEQQKIQSEVALSLLGIPRSEVALGIFSDVNTYDVNPTEWSTFPNEYTFGHGIKHLPQEAGALVQAPKDDYSILSSKRFFRYQPGRVSAATFGVKSSKTPTPDAENGEYDLNPSIRKYGIFDKYDGYYWESKGDFSGDNFTTVRRTQSLLYNIPVEFSNTTTNQTDYRYVGKPSNDPTPETNAEPRALEILFDNKYDIIYNARIAARDSYTVGTTQYDHIENNAEKCERDMEFALDAYISDLQYSGIGHTITNATTYRTALLGSGNTLITEAEAAVHTYLAAEIIDILVNTYSITTLNGAATTTRVDSLRDIIVDAVNGTQPISGTLTSTSSSIWGRDKITTVFSIYKRYYGYLISTAYDNYIAPSGHTIEEIKNKCLRDVSYIMDGYSRDLAFNGDAGTIYNALNYYFALGGSSDLQVYSQLVGSASSEIEAHTIVKTLLTKTSAITSADEPSVSWNFANANISNFTSLFDLFGFSTTARTKLNGLCDLIIDNFTTPYIGAVEYGDAPQYGDLVVLRDNLIHIHAAVFDPSLLKQKMKIRVKVDDVNNTLTVAQGEFVIGQHINFYGDAGGLTDSKTYVVKTVDGPKGNIITLYDPLAIDDTVVDITSVGTDNKIEPNIPFVFPDVYHKGTDEKGGVPQGQTFRKPDGMFPYMYVTATASNLDSNGNELNTGLPTDGDTSDLFALGFINTAIDTTSDNYVILKQQIDAVNFAYNNWVKQNVDPKYYSVYEYRVPRSRFSSDKLDGQNRTVVYSDVSTGEFEGQSGVTVRPGQAVLSDGQAVSDTSAWNIDMSKVTMLKIEFSWYGAVGAMFLAYVPVGNNEARWVRVHHMRASNQLKISSLGNATLPITYLTYGGGSVEKMGIDDLTDKTYGTASNHIVKYGASYYIDGGDRGTVRLYSHTNLSKSSVYGNEYSIGAVTQLSDTIGSYITIGAGDGPTDKTFFMKAQVLTNSPLDQNTKVIWVDGNKIYLSAPLNNTNNVRLVAKRPSLVFGLKAKENIFNSEAVGIRNRVQVYPTKMSTGNYGSSTLNLDILKTPIFQTITETSGVLNLTDSYEITASNSALPVSNATYLSEDGEYIYGWFLSNVGTVFGKLSRIGGLYYFTLKEIFNVPVILYSGIDFLKDGRFGFDGTDFSDTVYESTFQKERLSSVVISNTIQSPIPETGSNVTSFFLSSGSEQFDLLSYFDYNKDYLSYPLTDEIESVYLSAYSSDDSNTSPISLNASLTWEEQ